MHLIIGNMMKLTIEYKLLLFYSPLEMYSFKPDVMVNLDSVIDASADVDLNPRPLLEQESSALTTQLSTQRCLALCNA